MERTITIGVGVILIILGLGGALYLKNTGNTTCVFNTAFNNNYRYLKISAKSYKNTSQGNYNISRFFVSNSKSFSSYGGPTGELKNYFIANGASSPNVTAYTTFTLDLNSITASSYYVGLHNCDSDFYIEKIWLTN